MKKIALLLILTITLISCSSDDDSNTSQNASVTFDFTQNFNGSNVTEDDFGSAAVYTNAAGNFMSITKLRYLISRINLHKEDGTVISFNEYHLIDLETASSLSVTPPLQVPKGDYTGISFVYGFNEEDNISGEYNDLNAVNWSWPSALGGGYHFMQLEGSFDDTMGAPQPYAYHNGTARQSDGVFIQNFIEFDLDQNFTINSDTSIEIKMDISEWFKNPYTWDLNQYSTDLMINYIAQILMNDNGQDVFSLGDIN